jgi:hypothetical protein
VAVKDGENEVTLLPPSTGKPPLDAAYQPIVQSPGAVALNVTVPLPQRALLLGEVGVAGSAIITPAVAVE